MKLLLQHGKLPFAPFSAEKEYDLLLDNGVIEKIGENLPVGGARVLDVNHQTILPGFIDMHCNICDPGYEYWEDIPSVSQSALRGGYTALTCAPNTNPTVDNKTVVEYIVSKSRALSKVHIYPYGSMSIECKGEHLAEMGEMQTAGIVAISDGDQSVENAAFLRNVLRYAKMLHLPVITHCEDRHLSGKGVMNEGLTSLRLGLAGMPKEAEEIIVARNIILAEAVGARLHIAHVSTRGSVELIREAKKRGADITCETSPHYFLLSEEAVDGYTTFAKVNPPLRTQSDMEALLEGIADGTIDVISSSHSPCGRDNKEKTFDVAPYGISSLETAFPLSYTTLVKSGMISMERLMELMSGNPAQILGLEKKGRIAEGMDADFVVMNLDQSYEIDPETFASKAKFSPFPGKTVWGRVAFTVIGGKVME